MTKIKQDAVMVEFWTRAEQNPSIKDKPLILELKKIIEEIQNNDKN